MMRAGTHQRDIKTTTEPSPFSRCDLHATGKITRAHSMACDISAKPFVTNKQRSAGSNHPTEIDSFASCRHVPKLCLGETHVPQEFLARREKTFPMVVKIRYARY
jgi:hypothetical protein